MNLPIPAPLLLGPANCEAMLGVNWRWLRDHAEELGIAVHTIERKSFVDAREAAEAIKRAGPATLHEAKLADEPVDDLEALRAKLGKRRRVG